jgi:hypothetical protein
MVRLNDNKKKYRRLVIAKLSELASLGLVKLEFSIPELLSMLLQHSSGSASTPRGTESPRPTRSSVATLKVDIDLDV